MCIILRATQKIIAVTLLVDRPISTFFDADSEKKHIVSTTIWSRVYCGKSTFYPRLRNVATTLKKANHSFEILLQLGL